jgi:DNA-binding transcriptional MerR regulator
MSEKSNADQPAEERLYTIGELTREFDVTSRTLRFYEDEGLLTPLRVGQKRLYRRRDRARLKLILRGKRLGFTLSEIRETFVLYEQPYGEAKQLRYYLQVLEQKRAQLLQRQQDINDILEQLDQSYKQCRELLGRQSEDPT